MRPLSSGAQDCYEAIGRRVPRRTAMLAPPVTVEPSTVGRIGGAATSATGQPPSVYTEADYQRHLAGRGPCPFGCCDGR